jgi:23S rRNA A2030 N6-methylase RlmJ
MANQHFGNLGDVWKHLWLAGVVAGVRPGQYVETHAGSALYRLEGSPTAANRPTQGRRCWP